MHDARGFTLLEVLIALAILAMALPILLGLRNFDLGLYSRAGDIAAATMLAQEKLMEAEAATAFPLGETGGDFQNPPPGAQSPADFQHRAEKYRWKRFVMTTMLPNVREVKIQIIWPQGAAEEMVEVSTYVFSSASL
ncbi:MAG: putative Type II secretion system protein I [Nitrospira sp.]